MSEMMAAFTEWAHANERSRTQDFQAYAHTIAEARYVLRRVLRIVDDQAKQRGLDPLQHQAMLQIHGVDVNGLSVNRIAERLDIAPAFASRLIKELEAKNLVVREQSETDRRVTTVRVTEEGIDLLREIDSAVHLQIVYFQHQFDDSDRLAALAIFAFYVGLASDSRVAKAIRDSVASADAGQPKRSKRASAGATKVATGRRR